MTKTGFPPEQYAEFERRQGKTVLLALSHEKARQWVDHQHGFGTAYVRDTRNGRVHDGQGRHQRTYAHLGARARGVQHPRHSIVPGAVLTQRREALWVDARAETVIVAASASSSLCLKTTWYGRLFLASDEARAITGHRLLSTPVSHRRARVERSRRACGCRYWHTVPGARNTWRVIALLCVALLMPSPRSTT